MTPIPRTLLGSLLLLSGQLAATSPSSADLATHPGGPYVQSLGFGQEATLDLSIENQNPTTSLDWNLVFRNESGDAMQTRVDSLDDHHAELLQIISDRHVISGGVSGNSISDGGGDMYDGGNQLRLNGAILNYSDGTPANYTNAASSATYFTRNYDGLFIFSADLDDVDEFAITGNLGADGYGFVSVEEFAISSGGISYRAFIKRVYGAGDPSINHLILVPDDPALARTHLNQTADENHRIAGLTNASQIHYLLFAKPSGAIYDTSVFQALAETFLDLILPGPPWFIANTRSGNIGAGLTSPLPAAVSALGLAPGDYATSFAIVPSGTDPATLPETAWESVRIEVAQPTFEPTSPAPSLVSIAGLSPDPLEIELQPTSGNPTPGNLSASTSEPWLSATVSDAGSIEVRFSSGTLQPGTHRGTVFIWDENSRISVEIDLTVNTLNLSKIIPDPLRPRFYAINQNGKEQGSILVIDALSQEIIKSIPVGDEPTDLDLTETSAELLVINTSDPSISRIDLTSLEVTQTHDLSEFSNRNDDFGGHIEDGPGSIVYYVDEQWGPRLRVFDTATGTVLQTFGSVTGTTPNTSNDYGYGDIHVSEDGSRLFGWRQYGDGAGAGGSHVVRFDIDPDGTLSGFTKSNSVNSSNFDREPFDTPILMTADGSGLVIKDRMVDQLDLNEFPAIYQEEIYSISPGAEIVSGASAIYVAGVPDPVFEFPAPSTVQAVSPDYSYLLYFDSSTGGLRWLDLIDTVGAEALGLNIFPADGGAVAQPQELRWIPQTGALQYRVFIGTDRGRVESADTSSPEFIGTSSQPTIQLPNALTSGITYFWRVDPVFADGATGAGPVRSFFVSTLTLSSTGIETLTLMGFSQHRESLALDAPTPVAWSVSADDPWVSFVETSGTTPSNLVPIIDATHLTQGVHRTLLHLTSGGISFPIPLEVRVYPVNYTMAKADLELDRIYAISQESDSSPDPSFLVVFDSNTASMVSVVPVGRSVTDIGIHYQENRLYLPNWRTGILRALDRSTLENVQNYQFSPFGGVGYSRDDIYRVAGGTAGRMVFEAEDQWVNINLADTSDGSILASIGLREGGGAFDPSGRYYYHGENNSSGADLTKYDISEDEFTLLATQRVDSHSYYGSRTVLLSGDGSRVYWNGGIFDRDLNVLQLLDDEVLSATRHGDVVFTIGAAFNGHNAAKLADLPVSTAVQAVARSQEDLFLFSDNTVTTVDLSSIAQLPGPGTTPAIADGTTVIGTEQTLSWSLEAFALSYHIYFGTDEDAVNSATPDSPLFLGESISNTWNGDLPALALDGEYFWRVDLVGFNGVQKGSTWSFDVAPIDITPREISVAHPEGSPISDQGLVFDAPTPLSWSASPSVSWLGLSATSGTSGDSVSIQFNTTGLAAGTYSGTIDFTSGSDRWSLPVSVEVIPLNFTLAVADLELDRIYAISQESETGNQPAHLLVIDSITNTITRAIPVGFSVTDLAVHYQAHRIYVPNWRTGVLRALDRNTFEEVQTYQFGPSGGYGTSSGDIFRVSAGRAGRLVIEQEDQWINVSLIDTTDGSILATQSEREGGGEFDPTGRYYYHGDSNISNASITRFDTDADDFVQIGDIRVTGRSSHGSRRVFLSGDGSYVYWNGGVMNPELDVLHTLSDEVICATLHGDLFFTQNGIYNGNNGLRIGDLPSTSSIQTVASAQDKLFLFEGSDMIAVDLAEIASLPPRGTIPSIPDGATVIGTNQQLGWTIEPFALSYDLYFGTDRNAVASASPGSAFHLGNVIGNQWNEPLSFNLDEEYYWRLDVNGFRGVQTGEVWSFDIAPIDIVPSRLEFAFPENSPIPSQTLQLDAPNPTPWSANTDDTPWLSLAESSGSTGSTLEVSFDSTNLDPGSHTGFITFTSGTDTWELPVTLDIIAMDVTVMIADPARGGVVYGINHADPETHFSHLLRIDGTTGRVTGAIEIGRNATDIDIDPTSGLLYAANHTFPVVQVVDLDTFSALPPITLDSNIEQIELDGRGQLYASQRASGVVRVWDLNAGTGSSLEGNYSYGQIALDDQTGHLFHARTYYSPTVTKLNIGVSPNVLEAQSSVLSGNLQTFELSADGSRAILGPYVLDPDTNVITQLQDPAQCLSSDGQLAAGTDSVWWSDSGAEAFALPVSARTSAFTADSSHLVVFNAEASSLRSLPVTVLPGPWPRPGQSLDESPSSFSWSPVSGASSYTLIIDGAPGGRRTYSGVSGTSFTLPTTLPIGRSYEWQVLASTPAGTVPSPTNQLDIRFPEGPEIDVSSGLAVAFGRESLLIGGDNIAWLHRFDPSSGISRPLQTFWSPRTDYYDAFGAKLAIDDRTVWISDYQFNEPADNSGKVFHYRINPRGFFAASNDGDVPQGTGSEQLGHGMAVAGDMLLAGTRSNTTSTFGRVIAYHTQPSLAQVQVIQPRDSEPGDQFGSAIAMRGNSALIAATGRGSQYNRLANAYIFTRNPATAAWSQSQELNLPNVDRFDTAATSIALGDNHLAINNDSDDIVYVYSKGTSTTWSYSTSIDRDDVPGATSSFGSSLACYGDLLLIGDKGANLGGISGGGVFTFRRVGNTWNQGPSIVPNDRSRSQFGSSLAVHDGWLLVGGSNKSWLFSLEDSPNHTPYFSSTPPSQAISGRQLHAPITAADLDGADGLVIEALQLPEWLELSDHGGGSASLRGTPNGASGTHHDIQLQVTDVLGASSLQTVRLELLAETDVPVIVMQPTGADLFAGQEVILRGSVEGIGPFSWQWQLDGIDIPGATTSTLNIPEIDSEDAGIYTFTVGNIVSTVTSQPARVNVRPADRFAGAWPTFGGGPRHSGFHPATLGRHTFVPAWQAQGTALHGIMQRPAIADGKVFITPRVYFGGSHDTKALDLESGETLWTHPFDNAYSINPPTYHNGRIYIQRGNNSGDTQLWCIDSESGATVWSSPHSAQWERYEAPTVTDDGIWVNGGSYGGMYGFAPDGTQLFFKSLAQVSGWTPAVSNGRLFTSIGYDFTEHNPVDGTILWSLKTEASGTSIPIISGNHAVVRKGNDLTCIDLTERSIVWNVTQPSISGSPAVARGIVYSIQGSAVQTHALDTGAPGATYDTDSTITSDQALVVNDHLMIGSQANTYIFDLATREVVQTLTGGADLAYSDGYLCTQGSDGTIHAYFANAAPDFTEAMPAALDSGAAADDLTVGLAAFAADLDPGDPLMWSILSVTRPEIFRTLELQPESGDLTVIYNPWESGSSDVLISITDSAGNVTETTITFTVPAHPDPELQINEQLVLNRQTGLYEHTIVVTHTGAREIAGFDLTISGLPDGVSIQNASNQVAGGGSIHHRQALAAGESTTLILEYHAPLRGTVIDPEVTVNLVTEPELDPEAETPGVAVERCLMLRDGGLLIEFTSTPGATYQVQYSDNASDWKVSPARIRAAGNRVQWIDRGPPRTDSPPADKSSRFYRVLELPSE